MAVLAGFAGGSAVSRSRNVNDERSINLYPEVPAGTAKVPECLLPTPGVRPFVVLDNAPVRALFAQDGRMFAVSGTSLYEVFASQTTALRGSTTLDGRPATISSSGNNGNQLFITSGGNGYIYDLLTNTVAIISDPDFPVPVEMGLFSDGYFLVLKRGTNQFNISALFDGTDWDALDFFQVSTVSDNLVAIIESHREIILQGTKTSSVWQNTGDALVVYQPMGGVKIEMGAAAPYAGINLDNTVYFIGESGGGRGVVYRYDGYTPVRVSTHAVEYDLNQLPRLSDAVAYGYQNEGHLFYVLYLPTNDTTWVYDKATNLWHEWAHWDAVRLRWFPHVGQNHCYAFGKHFVGARNSGAIYELSLELPTDRLVV